MKALFKPTSYRQGAFWAIEATLVWKTISFINALLLALYFGASRQTDVYFFLIMVTGFGVSFLQRLNQTVLIPEAMFLTQEQAQTGREFLTMWLYIYGLVALILGLAGTYWPDQILEKLSAFSGKLLASDKTLLTCALWVFALQIITYYLAAVTEMHKFFKTAWLGVFNALCPLIGLLLFGRQVGIISMLYGFLVANILQILILLVLIKTQLDWNFAPAWIPLRTQTRQNMLTGQTLAILDMINSWLPLYLISGMGTGLVSALNYCKQFTDSTTEVFTARAANIAKIKMTEQLAQKQTLPANETFINASYFLLVLLAPLVIFSCYFAPQIVDLFFKRGEFNAQSARDTVSFLCPMLFTLLLGGVGYLQNSAISASRKIKEWFPYALASELIFMGMLGYGIPRYGAFIYPYIIGAGLFIGFVLNFFLFKKQMGFFQYTKPLRLILRLTLLAGLALVPASLLSGQISQNSWVQILGCGSIFVAAYIGILYLSKDLQKLREFLTNHF